MEPGAIHGREETSEVGIGNILFLSAIKNGASPEFGGFCGRVMMMPKKKSEC